MVSLRDDYNQSAERTPQFFIFKFSVFIIQYFIPSLSGSGSSIMYLHLGKGTVIPESSIIGIFDLDITSQSRLTRGFLSMAEKAGEVVNAAEDIPKSFVVSGEKTVYLSQMATATLLRRTENKTVIS